MRNWLLSVLAVLALISMSSCTHSQSPLPGLNPNLKSSRIEADTGLEQKEDLQEATGMRINISRLKIVLDWF